MCPPYINPDILTTEAATAVHRTLDNIPLREHRPVVFTYLGLWSSKTGNFPYIWESKTL